MLASVKINELLKFNFEYVKENGYCGYDPKIYDYMPMTARASFNTTFINKVLRRIEIEIFRRNFPNLLLPYLNFCKIDPKTTIPYGLGVFIQCYAQMYKLSKNEEFIEEAKRVADILTNMLVTTENGLGIPNPSNGKEFKYGDGIFNDSTIFLPGGSEVFLGFHELYLVTKDNKYLEICNKIVDSFMNDFKQKVINDDKLVLDYSNTGDNSHVLNANALAMVCISIMYKETQNLDYKNFAMKIYNYIEPYLYYENIPYSGIEDKESDSSWFGCDTYHTGFTLRSMYEAAEILNLDTNQIIKKIKAMMDDFLINEKVVIYKGKGQIGLKQDAHAFAEYIRIFATFYNIFDKAEQEKYLEIIMKNLESFTIPSKKSYYYTINKNKKFYLYMPRWSHAPIMNALAILESRLINE